MPAVFAQGSSGKAIRRFQLALTTVQVPKPGGGTEPALEVLVPKKYSPEPLLLPAFSAAAQNLPANGLACR